MWTLCTTYISPQTQNELLDALRLEIEDTTVSEIRQQDIGPKFCIMANEVSDVINWEQLDKNLLFKIRMCIIIIHSEKFNDSCVYF